VVIVAAAWFAMRPASPAAPAPAPTPVKHASRTVRLTLASEPAGASVVVTEGETSNAYTTPVTIDRPAPNAVATFRAEGFQTVARVLDASVETELRIALEPVPPAPEATSPEAAPTRPAPKKPAKKAVGDGMMDVDL
jgi:hypothetical protein